MKQFKVLFMLLIGMIGFTCMATTTTTEQKQKTEVTKQFVDNVNVVTVLATNDVAQEVLFVVSNPVEYLHSIDVGDSSKSYNTNFTFSGAVINSLNYNKNVIRTSWQNKNKSYFKDKTVGVNYNLAIMQHRIQSKQIVKPHIKLRC